MLEEHFNIAFIVNSTDHAILTLIKLAGYEDVTSTTQNGISSFDTIKHLIIKADVVVLDFYTVTENLQLSIKTAGYKLVCIDDLHQTHFFADAVINVSNSISKKQYKRELYTKLYLGTSYVLLRPEFLKSALQQARTIDDINSVFINMGGSDAPNNTLKFLKAITRTRRFKNVHVVLGALNPHRGSISEFVSDVNNTSKIYLYTNIDEFELKKVISDCELAICPASGISMELSAVGIAMITGYTADNQKDLLQGLIEKDCAFNIGNFNDLSADEITEAVEHFIIKKPVINKMIKNQKKMIDGQSPARLREIFEAL